MEEFLQGLWETWSAMGRQERQATIVFGSSFPLGVLGLGIGLSADHSLLFWLGLINIVVSAVVVLFMGMLLLTVVFAVIKAALKGLLWIITWPFRRRTEPAPEPEPISDVPPTVRLDATGNEGFIFDLFFAAWAVVSMVQIFQLAKYFLQP